MLCYIPPCSFGVKKVPVMKIRCREIRRWWKLNRKECVVFRSHWSILQLGICFWFVMWWLFSFGNLFRMLWHCFFQGSGMLAGISCSYSTTEYCSECILDKDAVKYKGETLLVQVHYHRYAWGYWQWPLLITMALWGSEYWTTILVRPSTSSHLRKGVWLSILMPLFCVSGSSCGLI